MIGFKELESIESEPTKYADDVNKLRNTEDLISLLTNEIDLKYSIQLDKCPQAFTKQRKFIEDSRARLEDNKITILDAIDALKEEKTALKEQVIENKDNEEKVNNQYDTVKQYYSVILDKSNEIKKEISLYLKLMQKLKYDRTKFQQLCNESQIVETLNKAFGNKLSKFLSQKEEITKACSSNELLQRISAFMSEMAKSRDDKIDFFENSKKEIENTNEEVCKMSSNSLEEIK